VPQSLKRETTAMATLKTFAESFGIFAAADRLSGFDPKKHRMILKA
jgi:hypothetical protein